VRRGDACGQTRPCAAVEEYVAAAVRMAEYAGTALVFLASDDPDTVLEVSALAQISHVLLISPLVSRSPLSSYLQSTPRSPRPSNSILPATQRRSLRSAS
jgi:hypothetical protein